MLLSAGAQYVDLFNFLQSLHLFLAQSKECSTLEANLKLLND